MTAPAFDNIKGLSAKLKSLLTRQIPADLGPKATPNQLLRILYRIKSLRLDLQQTIHEILSRQNGITDTINRIRDVERRSRKDNEYRTLSQELILTNDITAGEALVNKLILREKRLKERLDITENLSTSGTEVANQTMQYMKDIFDKNLEYESESKTDSEKSAESENEKNDSDSEKSAESVNDKCHNMPIKEIYSKEPSHQIVSDQDNQKQSLMTDIMQKDRVVEFNTHKDNVQQAKINGKNFNFSDLLLEENNGKAWSEKLVSQFWQEPTTDSDEAE